MGSSKKTHKSKKESKKHKRRRRSYSESSSDGSSSVGRNRKHHRKHKSEKKPKFRPPKRRRASSSSATSSNYGDMNELLKTPPKHQKTKRILYRRKIRNIDPDMFLSLKKFAYDKEKMIENAFTTLRRGVIERICPAELEHLSVDELKERLIKLGSTMSKERLRNYVDDNDLSHSSDSSEVETPTDDSESELEVVSDTDLVNALLADKEKLAQAKENEIRERLTRRRLLAKLEAKAQAAKGLEAGEIDDDNVGTIPLPPMPPLFLNATSSNSIRLEYENTTVDTLRVFAKVPSPPPPPSPEDFAAAVLKRNERKKNQVEHICLAPIEVEDELDYDELGEDPDIDLC